MALSLAACMAVSPLAASTANAETQVVVSSPGASDSATSADLKKIDRFHRLNDSFKTKWAARKPGTSFKKALSEFKLALGDWKKVNGAWGDAHAAIIQTCNDLVKSAKNDFNAAVTAANTTFSSAVSATKGSKDAPALKKAARAVRDAAVAAAVVNRNSAIKAAQVTRDAELLLLGVKPLAPAKPVSDGKGGVKA